jgi:hypothetical protein
MNFIIKALNCQPFFFKSQNSEAVANAICEVIKGVRVQELECIIIIALVTQHSWHLIEELYTTTASYGCEAQGIHLPIKNVNSISKNSKRTRKKIVASWMIEKIARQGIGMQSRSGNSSNFL